MRTLKTCLVNIFFVGGSVGVMRVSRVGVGEKDDG